MRLAHSKIILLILFPLLLMFSNYVKAELVDRIVAVINNDTITLSELDEIVFGIHGDEINKIISTDERKKTIDNYRKTFLEQLLDQRVITQKYSKLGLSVSEDEIKTVLDNICKQNNITQDLLIAEVEKQGMQFSSYQEQLRQQILQGKFIDNQIRSKISIKEEDVKDLYQKQIAGVDGSEVIELTGFLIPMTKASGPDVIASAHKKASDARKLYLQGLSIEAIIKQFSDTTITNLSEMGSFKRGELVDSIDSIVFSLNQSDITEPIETSQGVYVLKIKNKSTVKDVKPYEEVRNQLFKRIYDQQLEFQLQKYTQLARKEAHVQIML